MMTPQEMFGYFSSNPHKLTRYAIDLKKQINNKENAFEAWEKCEKGSINAVLTGYLYILNELCDPSKKSNISCKDIQEIHRLVTTNVTNDNGKPLTNSPGLFRGDGVAFGVEMSSFKSTLEKKEDLNYLDDELLDRFLYSDKLKLSGDKRAHLCDLLNNNQKVFFLGYLPTNEDFNKLNQGTEQEKTGHQSSQATQNPTAPISFMVQGVLADKIEGVFEKYYADIQAAKDIDEKLTIIATKIQELEQIHPFPDANCRTLCNILLNWMLIENGFPFALVEDPNYFDLYKVSDLIKLMKDGIEKTEQLCKETSEIKNELCPLPNNMMSKEIAENFSRLLKQLNDEKEEEKGSTCSFTH